MQVDDFDRAWSEIDKSAVNRRWQEEMAPLFESASDGQAGERFPMMQEVFYLE
jgi:L-rhamnose mutarotase